MNLDSMQDGYKDGAEPSSKMCKNGRKQKNEHCYKCIATNALLGIVVGGTGLEPVTSSV